MQRYSFAAILAVSLFAISISNASADPIVDLSGGHNFVLTSNGNIATITFPNGTTSVANGNFVGPYPTAFASPTFTINSGTLLVTGLPTIDGKVINTGTGTTGNFNFLSASLSFPQANVLIINGTEILTQNTNDPNFDLSPFFNGGSFTFTLNAGNGVNLQDIIQNGGQVVATGSFSETANAVPEPASIAVWSVLGLTLVGGYFMVQRRQAATQMAA